MNWPGVQELSLLSMLLTNIEIKLPLKITDIFPIKFLNGNRIHKNHNKNNRIHTYTAQSLGRF